MIAVFFSHGAILTVRSGSAIGKQSILAYSANSTEATVCKNETGTAGLIVNLHHWQATVKRVPEKYLGSSRVLQTLAARCRFHCKILYVFLSAKAP